MLPNTNRCNLNKLYKTHVDSSHKRMQWPNNPSKLAPLLNWPADCLLMCGAAWEFAPHSVQVQHCLSSQAPGRPGPYTGSAPFLIPQRRRQTNDTPESVSPTLLFPRSQLGRSDGWLWRSTFGRKQKWPHGTVHQERSTIFRFYNILLYCTDWYVCCPTGRIVSRRAAVPVGYCSTPLLLLWGMRAGSGVARLFCQGSGVRSKCNTHSYVHMSLSDNWCLLMLHH